LEDLLLDAEADLVERSSQLWMVVIPVLAAPHMDGAKASEWRDASQISSLIEEIEPAAVIPRQNGGFVLDITARDPYAAVERAEEKVDRWAARVELATERVLELAGRDAWVRGVSRRIPLAGHSRRIEIGALTRESQLYTALDDGGVSQRIDDALQILRPIKGESRSAAISGGWAAIETLLTSGGEPRSVAADRLAAIIACSYPRAELTTLSYLHAEHGNDELSSDLSGLEDNLSRARLVAEALVSGRSVVGRGHRDNAACDRMREVLRSPRDQLAKVREYVRTSLLRMYRQRNLIVHGGIVSGDGRRIALGMAAPLIGAGIDRIAHAWFTEQLPPLELAARADLSLHLVNTAGGPGATELLEARK
jgi:hypothetical protein